MVTEELTATIRQKFLHGQRRDEIKYDLIQEGYEEEDIDQAVAQIQHDAIKQLPGISSLYYLIESFEKKTSLTTPKMTVLGMFLCIGFLFLFAAVLYFVFDPFGMRTQARDAERASDVAKMQTALGYYYQQNSTYPKTLNQLVPTFLSVLPRDPESEAVYSYKPLDNNTDYQLCASYELQQQQCVNALSTASQIPNVPTATPTIPFIPQSASGSVSATQPVSKQGQ